jgi:ribonucleoside-triphosphate reductase
MTPINTLRQLVHQRTYALTLPSGQKESRKETIDRCANMHKEKFPKMASVIDEAFSEVNAGRVVPSMRSLQFGGDAILRANARIYNCAFANLTKWEDFADLFYLLMCGTGTGYSVQKRHVEQLPAIDYEKGVGDIFVVEDNKEGWADTLKTILYHPATEIDVHKIRRKGTALSSGGTASGPEALLKTIAEIKAILRRANGRKLRPLEAHDIMCHVANGVVVGGVRRAALISLFDCDDKEMLAAKHGMWWDYAPQRARANNSALILRDENVEKNIRNVMQHMYGSGAGEPGIALTNNLDMGGNPCFEIALNDGQLCNLTEVNVAACNSIDEFLKAVEAATTIGTLQASYTDFTYLQPKWRETCEREALLGVSLTGQAQKWKELESWLKDERVKDVLQSTNKKVAEAIGIQPSARITTTKPSGTTSAWLGTTSGIHAAHSDYYIRRVRVDVNDPIAKLVKDCAFVEQDIFNPENLVISIPVASPDAITRSEESAIDLMNRAKYIHSHWISAGHIYGDNTHNVSLTVSYHPEEKEEIVNWLVENNKSWMGISFLPYDGGTYRQAPFEQISEDAYNLLVKAFDIPELDNANYINTIDERIGEMACAGGACEYK